MRNKIRVPLYFYYNEMIMGVGLALIGATAVKSGLDSHEAHEQRKLAKKQMAEQERLAKLQAGQAPKNTENVGDIEGSNESKMSAIRRTILTRTQQSGTKLGD